MNAHFFAVAPNSLIGNRAVDLGKKRIVLAHPDIVTRVNSGSQLAHQNIACFYLLPAETLDASAWPFFELPPAFL